MHGGRELFILSEKCSRCGKDSAITLRYAGKSLCETHFLRFFEARALRTVRAHRMLARGDRVALGLSGGKDSTVMLHILHKISKSLPIKLIGISIDEGIRGYRATRIEIARKECRKCKIPIKVFSFKKLYGKTLDALLSAKGTDRSCSLCGVMRRHAINKAARMLNADKLAIGHNSDDIAQTVIMNLMRNEPERMARFGPNSGALDDPLFVKRIKPLFLTPERDIAAYAMIREMNVAYGECPYAKNAFRQHVRKILNETEEKYPATKLRIVRAYLSQQPILLEGLKSKLEKEGRNIGRCVSCGEPASGKGTRCSMCSMLN